MRSVSDKVVVITGASRGIGEAIARAFAAEQTRLVLCGRSQSRLNKVARSLNMPKNRIATVATDIMKPAGMRMIVKTALRQFGVIDIFINNAGVGAKKNILDTTQKDYDLMMDTNLKAVFFSLREVLPVMKKQQHGHIINISSMAGRTGVAGLAVYSASKAALNALSEGVAGEMRNDNIKVSVLAPGSTDTAFSSGITKKQVAHSGASVKLTAAEVAEAVVFLAKQNQNAFTSMMELRPLITKPSRPS